MAENFTVDFKGGVAKITLSGRLDTTKAPALTEELKKMIGQPVSRIVFFAKDLEYIASSGLRAIVFAKQKIGKDTKVYLIGAHDEIKDVIKMTGFDNFLITQDTYEDATNS
ncbi:MAG: STAS domain-containing protein [Candidatus Wallbacteria bacterium]|nr:STAS domain-containing protein [Candidatus Wallbacteria bacterium]